MKKDQDLFSDSNPIAVTATHKISRVEWLGAEALPCWIATPELRDPTKPPLVAVHGLHRGAKAQATILGAQAAQVGQTVIAPLFNRDDWPSYQQVVRKRRADLALLSLLDDLAVAGVGGVGKFDLCGYSGGAQFAHRFAMLYPHRVARLTVIAAGWYTFPGAAPFPYGLGAPDDRRTVWRPRSILDLAGFFSLSIQVLVGTEDDQVDENTRSGPEIDAQQGRTRRERARRWVSAIRDAALQCGVEPNVTLNELDGCGHDFCSCLAHPDAFDGLFPNL